MCYQTTPLGISYHDNAHWGRLGIVPTLDGEGDDPSEIRLALAGPMPALKEWLTAEYPEDMEFLDDAEQLDDDDRAAYFAAVKEQHRKALDHLINTDLRWLMARLFEEFPEFTYDDDEDGPVSGSDLVQFMANQLHNMPNLKRLKVKDPCNSVEVLITGE
jgi:hypothetical protein